MDLALLISNRLPEESGGRAGKIDARLRLMTKRGWEVHVGHVPPPYILGALSAFLAVLRQARSEQPDLIVSINNPFHLHVHGLLVSQITGTPWIAELRDPIATHPGREKLSPTTWLARVVERLTVRFADRVVWHDGIQLADDYFERRYPGITEKVVQLPPMGYLDASFSSADPVEYDRFTLTYAGSFYEGWIEPFSLLNGLGIHKQTGGDRVTAQFYGDWNGAYDEAARDADVKDWITTHEFVPHERIVSVLKGSDALLYIGGDDPGNRRNLPSKLWDYVGAGVPILAVVDPSFRVAEFVREYGLGLVVSPGDEAGIAAAIETLQAQSFESELWQGDGRFTRENSANVISQVMSDTISSGEGLHNSQSLEG